MRTTALSLLVFLASAAMVSAADYSSTNFINRDPVISVSGGYSTSTNFQLYSGSGQTVVTESTSTSFTARSGFFYWPLATSPVLTATAGSGQVTLTWTASVGSLGFTVSAYEVAQAAAPGGPYTYTGVGNVLTSDRGGLTNGTTYYFVIRALDALSTPVASSTEVSATPVAGTDYGVSAGPGAPAGETVAEETPTTAAVVFRGAAPAGSTVVVLHGGEIVGTAIADETGAFTVVIPNLPPETTHFSLYAVDTGGNRTGLVTLPETLAAGATLQVDGVILPPTTILDKTEVKEGDFLEIYGAAPAAADVFIYIDTGEEPWYARVKTGEDGRYRYLLPTEGLSGPGAVKVRIIHDGLNSDWGLEIPFTVGGRSVPAKPASKCAAGANLDDDCRQKQLEESLAAVTDKPGAVEKIVAKIPEPALRFGRYVALALAAGFVLSILWWFWRKVR